jgi:Zn-dependent protease with chaperone function
MGRRDSLYPPSPKNVPPDLTVPSGQFRFQVFIILVALIVFFLLYLSLLGASAFLVFWGFTHSGGKNVLLINVLLPCLGLLLFLFLLKGFFKRQRKDKSLDIEIAPDEHPRLFDFVERLCDEVGARLPRRIYVNFEVNAAAVPDLGFLSLFWSSAQDLRIGLGLVNVLNLTEFKALLAHEFGHFSQHSMKIGGYVYMSRRIIGDLVYGRDFLDTFLDGWRQLDVRISWPAWIFAGLIWFLRLLLHLLHQAIFFGDKAMSRQMEFNADLVAVSVTGSDAPVHLLAHSVFGDLCLNQALKDLSDAADHHLYSRDLFHHQDHAASFVRRISKKPELGMIPPLPENPRRTTQVFEPDDDERLPVMWLDHPSNFDREENAKDCYIRSTFDPRTAWELFDDVEELKERVSYRFYRVFFKVSRDVVLAETADVQAYIDEERAETTYDPRYHGVYDNRNIEPGKLTELADLAGKRSWSREQLVDAHANLYDDEVKRRSRRYYKRFEEANLLQDILHKRFQPKNDEFEFRGYVYETFEAKKLVKKLERELEADHEWFARLDRDVFLVHYQMALQTDARQAGELLQRYEFHLGVQKIWTRLNEHINATNAALQWLQEQGSSRLTPDRFRELVHIFVNAHDALADSLDDARDLILPPLRNMVAGEPLRPFLLSKKLVKGLGRARRNLSGDWIDKFMTQLGEVHRKVNRVHFKSLGGVLALQEEISQSCLGFGS